MPLPVHVGPVRFYSFPVDLDFHPGLRSFILIISNPAHALAHLDLFHGVERLVELVGVAEVEEGDEIEHEVEGGRALPRGVVPQHPVPPRHLHRRPLDAVPPRLGHRRLRDHLR